MFFKHYIAVMKQLFSLVLCLFMLVGISTVTLASDVIDKASFETVDVEFEQSSFDFVVLEVVKQPTIFISHVQSDLYEDYIILNWNYNWIVDVGKHYDYLDFTTNTNSLKSQYTDLSPLEIVNARSRLMFGQLNQLA